MLSPHYPRIKCNWETTNTRLALQHHITQCFTLEVKEREVAIQNTLATYPKMNRIDATIFYDMYDAPITTNADMLRHCDLDPNEMEDTETHLNFLLDCLAGLNIFIKNHKYLQDGELYHRLLSIIETETVRFLPPTQGVNEYLDLQAGEPIPETIDPDAPNIIHKRYMPEPWLSDDAVIDHPNTPPHISPESETQNEI